MLILLSLLLACTPSADDWGVPDPEVEALLTQLPPPPFDLTMTATNMVAGGPGSFTISGATPGAQVRLMRGMGGLLDGVCPPALGFDCVDIAGLYRRVQTVTADSNGEAVIEVTPPGHAGGVYIGFQAFVLSPVPQISNPVGRLLANPGTIFYFDADEDEDKFTINEGDCADFDPSIDPRAVDVLGDGWDHDCDNSDAADNDRDGHKSLATAGDDCDDQDATTYAGATEVCDGRDNDCDGVVDNGGCYVWSYVRVDDCTGGDFGQSQGEDPDRALCHAGHVGRIAVKWDGVTYFNGGGVHPWWTYKTTPAAACVGGGAPGLLHECVYLPPPP